jgi:hypothetical protein
VAAAPIIVSMAHRPIIHANPLERGDGRIRPLSSSLLAVIDKKGHKYRRGLSLLTTSVFLNEAFL